MKIRVLLLVSLLIVNLCLSNPLFFLTSTAPRFTIQLYNKSIKLSMSQPFLYNNLPVDWFLPEQNKELLKGLISVESSFNVHALSSEGAIGLTQLMPGTARYLNVRNAFNAFQSIDGANRYINELVRQFGDLKTALAAYYEGPTRVRNYGPSSSAIKYAENVLDESKRLARSPVFLKDVFYMQPYVQLGNKFGVGMETGFSILGMIDFVAMLGYEEQFKHRIVAYPRITHELAIMVGEDNSNLLLGISYEQPKDFGVEFYVTMKNVSLSSYLKVLGLFVKLGWSFEDGLYFGIMR